MTGLPVINRQSPRPIVAAMGTCYLLGILGYALGMALSLAGQVPAGLAVVCAAAAVAVALFGAGASPLPCDRRARPD